jgi:hypothetical protein
MENTNRSREAVILVFVVFVLGFLSGGVANHIYGTTHGAEPKTLVRTQRPKAQVVQEFTDRLHLSADQQQQLGTIIGETRSRWRDLYAPLEAQHEQIRQEGRAKIRAMLTPEQLPEFDKFMQVLDKRHQQEKAQEQSDR